MFLRCSNFFSPVRTFTIGAAIVVAVSALGQQTTTPDPSIQANGSGAEWVTTNQYVTPSAAPNSLFQDLKTNLRPDDNANGAEAVSTALSPDGKTLLILTSGYNYGFYTVSGTPIVYPILDPATGQPTGNTTPAAEWIFVYDVSGPVPVQKQKLNVPVTYCGLAWAPGGSRFYVSGGIGDVIYVFKKDGDQFVGDFPWVTLNTPQQLAGTPAGPRMNALGYAGYPVAAGIAVSPSGATLYVANYENDSISIVDTATRQVTSMVTFFEPGQKVATGEYPFWISVVQGTSGHPDKVFVSSQRDSQVVVFDDPTNIRAIPSGLGSSKMILNRDASRLYVANSDADSVTVIDTAAEKVVSTISMLRPAYKYTGANPNSLALSADETQLFVTLGGENAVAVIDLASSRVIGRIPVGWYPNAVSVSADGKRLYVVNAKDMPGPNPANSSDAPNPANRSEYIYALEKAHLSTIPVPDRIQLAALSKLVDSNNGFNSTHDSPLMSLLRNRIKHVIFIVRENRTYDQVLGDLPKGNGDPSLAIFPQPITPNAHKLALEFTTMDNFYETSEVSGDGWNWTTQSRTNDYTAKSVPASYGNGFGTLDVFGTNRSVEIGLPQSSGVPSQFTERITHLIDPTGASDILPGTRDISTAENEGELNPAAVGGYLWDEAVRSGKVVRHYGYFTDENYYYIQGDPLYIPIDRYPYQHNVPQGPPLTPTLAKGVNDPYYRGFDMSVPDRYHYEEWKREFDHYVAKGNLPDLQVMSLPLDHTGSFDSNVGGLNTPSLQVADNDYALGKIVADVTHSPYWKDTAIFVVEDDAQDGPDHVDAHRAPAFVISPYTKRGALVHTRYTQLNVMRTIEDLLGLKHLSMYDANVDPMDDVFTLKADLTAFDPVIPGVLCQPPVDPNLIPECTDENAEKTPAIKQIHDGAWWSQQTKGFDFRHADSLDAAGYNRLLWRGIKGDSVPYPAIRTGIPNATRFSKERE